MLFALCIPVAQAQILNYPYSASVISNGVSARGNSLFAGADNHSYWWVHTLEYVETFTEGPAGMVGVKKWSNNGELLSDFILSSNVIVFDVNADEEGNVVMCGIFQDSLMLNDQLLLLDENSFSDMNNFVLYINASGTQIEAWNMDVFSEYGFSYPTVTFGLNNEIICAGSDYMTGWIYRWSPEEQPQLWLSGTELKVFGDIEVNEQGQVAFASACFQGQVSIGDQIFTAPNAYNALIVVLDSNANCAGVLFIPDITIQFAEVEWLPNGRVLAAGDWYNGGFIGPFELLSPQWVYSYFLCEMEPNGNVTWATSHPINPNGIAGDFEIARRQSISTTDNGDFYLFGKQRGDVYWTQGLQTIGADESSTIENSGTLVRWQNHEPISAQMIHGGGLIQMDQVLWHDGLIAVSGTNEYSDTLYCNDALVYNSLSAFTFLLTSNNTVGFQSMPLQHLSWNENYILCDQMIGEFTIWNAMGMLVKSDNSREKEIDIAQLHLSSGCYLLQTQYGILRFMTQ